MQFDTGALECETDLNEKLNKLFYKENAKVKLVEPWGLGVENATQYIEKNWKHIVATSLGPYLEGDVTYHDLIKRNSVNGMLELSQAEYQHLRHVWVNRKKNMVNVIIEFCVNQDMLRNEAAHSYPWMKARRKKAVENSVLEDVMEATEAAPQARPDSKARPSKKRKK